MKRLQNRCPHGFYNTDKYEQWKKKKRTREEPILAFKERQCEKITLVVILRVVGRGQALPLLISFHTLPPSVMWPSRLERAKRTVLGALLLLLPQMSAIPLGWWVIWIHLHFDRLFINWRIQLTLFDKVYVGYVCSKVSFLRWLWIWRPRRKHSIINRSSFKSQPFVYWFSAPCLISLQRSKNYKQISQIKALPFSLNGKF